MFVIVFFLCGLRMTDLGFGDSGLFVFASPISALQVAYRVLEASSGLVAATGAKRKKKTCRFSF